MGNKQEAGRRHNPINSSHVDDLLLSQLIECVNELKDKLKYDTGCIVTEGPLCGQPVCIVESTGVYQAFNILTGTFEDIDVSKVGKNPSAMTVETRQFVCELYGEDKFDNATILASLAGATMPQTGHPADDATSVYMHNLSITLGHLGDEDQDGNVSTTCDAYVIDVDPDKKSNLEPGETYEVSVQPGFDIQQLVGVIAEGSMVKVCGCVSVRMNKAGEVIPKSTEKKEAEAAVDPAAEPATAENTEQRT